MSTVAANTDTWDKVRAESAAILGDDIVALIDACRAQPHPDSNLISILHRVQGKLGYLPTDAMNAVAQLLQVPATKVSGVATFYHFFRLNKPGKFKIAICLGTACYVKGSEAVADKLKDELGIDYGETSKDGMFTLEAARCVGTCGLAPVAMIGDEVHGSLTPEQVPALLAQYRAKVK